MTQVSASPLDGFVPEMKIFNISYGGEPYRDGFYQYYLLDIVANNAHSRGSFILASVEIECH